MVEDDFFLVVDVGGVGNDFVLFGVVGGIVELDGSFVESFENGFDGFWVFFCEFFGEGVDFFGMVFLYVLSGD